MEKEENGVDRVNGSNEVNGENGMGEKSNRGLELMDFYADWCGPCQMMRPIVEEFERAHPEVRVRRVNIDEEVELAEKHRVSGIPCLMVVRDGEEVMREVGVVSLRKLEKMWRRANG